MKRVVVAAALVGTLALPGIARAGSSTDAALALGAFAVFNQILSGTGVFGAARVAAAPPVVYAPAPPVVYAPPPPPVVYAPAPPPPPVVYAPAPRVVYQPAPPPVVVYSPPRRVGYREPVVVYRHGPAHGHWHGRPHGR